MSQLRRKVWHVGDGTASAHAISTTATATTTRQRPRPRQGLARMQHLDDLILDQEAQFLTRTPRSQEMWAKACDVMPGGVTSSWASTRPIPVWIERGHGSHVWDVDGNEYVDYHAGYGVNVVGHANPHVVDAVQERVTMG